MGMSNDTTFATIDATELEGISGGLGWINPMVPTATTWGGAHPGSVLNGTGQNLNKIGAPMYLRPHISPYGY